MLRVGVHHQALQQRLVVRSDQHRHEALMGGVPPGVAVCRHDGVVICHGREIGAFTVQILHDGLSHLGGLQRILVKVLTLPVGKAFFDHLCHSLVVVLVKGDEQVRLVLDLLGVIALRPDDADGVAVDIAGIVRAVALSVVVPGKGRALLVE